MCPCLVPQPTCVGTLVIGANSSTGTLTFSATNPVTGVQAWFGTLTGTAGSWYCAIAWIPLNQVWEYCFFQCTGGFHYDVYWYTCPITGGSEDFAGRAVPSLCGAGSYVVGSSGMLTLSGTSTCSPFNVVFTTTGKTITFTP